MREKGLQGLQKEAKKFSRLVISSELSSFLDMASQ
jgi:hypothetical protein